MRRLVLMHKDRLLRFGAGLVFALCEAQGIEIVIVNQGEQPSFEQEFGTRRAGDHHGVFGQALRLAVA